MRAWQVAGLGMAAGLAGLAGCGAAQLAPEELGVTARDAFVEGRTRAATWDAGARLRWVEGVSISPLGMALPPTGEWRMHYTAPGRTTGLVVVVAPLRTSEEERPPASPPGYDIGQATVGDTWVDSPEALTRVLAVRGAGVPAEASLLLVPLQPLQWVVWFPDEERRWRLDAGTGQVLTP